jgi:hypothetical protein
MIARRAAAAAIFVSVVALAGAYVLAQDANTPAALRAQLNERFQIVALQRGIALIPRAPDAPIRLIQVVDGVVTIDGQTLTGQELRDRLGDDAAAVLRISYLDEQGQREMSGAPGEVVPASPPGATNTQTRTPPDRSQVRRGGIVRFGEDITVGRNERIQGDVVSLGGSVDVDGEVTGDVAAIGGSVRLGPDADVGGDVNVVGGTLERDPNARIGGDVEEVGSGEIRGRMGRTWRFGNVFENLWSSVGSLAATMMRLALLMLLGVAAVAIARPRIEDIAAVTTAAPVRAGLIGLLGQLLFVPVLALSAVVLAVSIIGIPLLVLVPFAVVLVMLAMLAGFLGLAYQLGGRLAQRLGTHQTSPYAAIALGVAAIGALTVIGKLTGLIAGSILGMPLSVAGYIVEYMAWTVGFGAAIVAWYDSQKAARLRRQTPGTPPVGPPVPASGEA